MNEQDKSLALAKLMGWTVSYAGNPPRPTVEPFNPYSHMELCPYDSSYPYGHGQAQAHAILLNHPQVILNLVELSCGCDGDWHCCGKVIMRTLPTQENILDEILRMNGVDV